MVDKDTTYYIFGLANCPSADDDSYWLKMDDGSFAMANGLGTNGWDWVRLTSYVLTAGEHTLTIAYRENGALLDKICISDYAFPPEGMGEEAENSCDSTSTGIRNLMDLPNGYALEQNYPNPFNPATTISFSVPNQSFVSLKVFDALGREVSILLSEQLSAGTYSRQWDAADLSSGVYFCRFVANAFPLGQASSFIETKKLILLR
jgi:hypothetical protein